MHPFGCRVLYYIDSDHRRKYEPTASEGVLLGYVDSGWQILDLKTYLQSHGRENKTITTRDCTFYDDTFPIAERTDQVTGLFTSELITIDEDVHTCFECGKFRFHGDKPVTCRRCLGSKRGRHAGDYRCALQRCKCDQPAEGVPEGIAEIIDLIMYEPSECGTVDSVRALEDAAIRQEIINLMEEDDFTDADVDTYIVDNKIEDSIHTYQGVITQINDAQTLSSDNDAEIVDLLSDSVVEEARSEPAITAFKEALADYYSTSARAQLRIRAQSERDIAEKCASTSNPIRYAQQEALAKDLLDSLYSDTAGPFHGCVVKELQKNSPEWNSELGQNAIRDELHKLTHVLKVADFDNPVDWDTIKSQGGPDERVGFKVILGIKNHEMTPDKWKYKARGCATGNWVTDTDGYQILEDRETLTGRPVEMTAARIAMCHGLSEGGVIETCDAASAYCQAPLLGSPKWLAIPPVLRGILKIPSHIKDPVCRMHKALYGLVRSGFDWAEHCFSRLSERGWTRVWEGEKNIFSKTFTDSKGVPRRAILVVHVDDFICAGKPDVVKLVWDEIADLFAMDEPEPLARFLGVHHTIEDAGTSVRGNKIRKLYLNQTDYCRNIVKEYKKVMGLPEDRKLRYVSTPLDDSWPSEEACPNWSDPGVHAPSGAKWCGQLLYLCRMTRPDLSTAVGRLSRQLCAWTKYTDHSLKRLISYMDTHDDYSLVIKVEENVDWYIRTYVDSDHAGDPLSTKSTTGVATFIQSQEGDTEGALSWQSKRQTVTSWSSGEAEVVALSESAKPALIHQLLAEGVANRPIKLQFCDDSSACIGAVKKGFSSMAYMEKTQKVRIGELHDIMNLPNVDLIKWPTDTNVADMFTKPLPREPFEKHRGFLGLQCMHDKNLQ